MLGEPETTVTDEPFGITWRIDFDVEGPLRRLRSDVVISVEPTALPIFTHSSVC